ncbi:hypothetical protein O9G_002233 [Rozella allomycis CSF55]|uniref:Uncharacterized protein n=1 Tax=Rozella allomycis (strain CSF55) TaxID=988480 RepID=A0A075B4H7_ROZAC|nr:hypothetical protein O9G_002233 [Rozella allomycis CSF55]|eukprot:EPZ36167.1 hypothetical protein O9G_002233 [Rozella allomycis CSF55]
MLQKEIDELKNAIPSFDWIQYRKDIEDKEFISECENQVNRINSSSSSNANSQLLKALFEQMEKDRILIGEKYKPFIKTVTERINEMEYSAKTFFFHYYNTNFSQNIDYVDHTLPQLNMKEAFVRQLNLGYVTTKYLSHKEIDEVWIPFDKGYNEDDTINRENYYQEHERLQSEYRKRRIKEQEEYLNVGQKFADECALIMEKYENVEAK